MFINVTNFITLVFLYRENLVNMDSETFRALKIFNQISHPSNFMKGLVSSNKEGLSVFGIFNRCKTIAGSKFMR